MSRHRSFATVLATTAAKLLATPVTKLFAIRVANRFGSPVANLFANPVANVFAALLVTTIAAPAFANSTHGGKIHFQPTTYCVQDLGAPPDQPPSDAGNLVIFGMNYKNQIVGTYAVGGRSRAYLWEPERGFTILGTLPGHDTAEANSINNAGVVIGSSGVYETGEGNSFIWDRRNGMRPLDVSLGGDRNGALDINSRGEITGSSTIDSDNFIDHAYFRARDGEVFDIGTFPDGNASTVGLALNDLGVVVGTESGGPFFARGFLWDEHRGLRPLTTQPERTSLLPHDINIFSTVVGGMSTPTGVFRPFRVVRRGDLQDLGSLGGNDTDSGEAYSVNFWGSVVGWTQDAAGAGRAFIWSERLGMRNLNDLIDPSSTVRTTLGVGKVINDLGAIAVEGISEGTGRGFLLTPRFHRNSPECD